MMPSPDASLADLRHALRTPLNHILGYSEMLLEDAQASSDTETEALLSAIRSDARSILSAIELTLSSTQDPGSVDRLRADIREAVPSMARAIGTLISQSTPNTLGDLFRMSAGAAELLSFVQGKQTVPRRKIGTFTSKARQTLLSGRLLIVDDNEANLDVMARQLEREGFSVETALDGAEALSKLNRERFSLVLLDVVMPGLSGQQVLEAIKSEERLRSIPVVMVSAFDELERVSQCIESGAEDYFTKPFQGALLRARIVATLERARLQAQERQRSRELERISQELQRSNEELNRFAFAASHDLQSPLRTIVSYLQLLGRRLEGSLNDESRELLDLAVKAAHQMNQLIQDLLSYSQVSSQQHELEPVACDLVIADTLSQLEALIQENGAQITHDPLPTIMANRILLVQLFQNLIANAIKYRRQEAPVVNITAEMVDENWHFVVRDNGMGIEPEYLTRVFEVFYRLHGRDRPGTGIGLAICQRVVERLGGRIWVESTIGVGSAFHFTVPVG